MKSYNIHLVSNSNYPGGIDIITIDSSVKPTIETIIRNNTKYNDVISIRVTDDTNDEVFFSTATYESMDDSLINENTYNGLGINLN